MRRVDLITDVPFWTAMRGDASRIRSLAGFLAPRTLLRVVMLAQPGQIPEPVIWGRVRAGDSDVELVGVIAEPRTQALANLQAALQKNPAAVALVEYVRLTWTLDALPAGTRAILDTHEVNHERNERFVAAGLPAPSALNEADEYAAFARYERVVLIQQEEGATVARRLGAGRVLVAPHPVRLLAAEVREHAHRIGFVGSEYRPNVEGLRWFLTAVWPRLGGADAVLDIYGGVGRRIDPALLPANARCHGTVADIDAAYRSLDIAINPVQVGAGLKIKTVEALGAGLPLVTTPEGARGILDAAGTAFLLAHDAGAFAAHLTQLLTSRARREQLARGARNLAAARFSPETCFGPLLRAIGENP